MSDPEVEANADIAVLDEFGEKLRMFHALRRSDDAAANAKIIMNVLNGEKSPYRDTVVMNAAVGFYVAGKARTILEGRQLAEESIDSKKALYSLQTLTTLSHS